MGKYEEQIKEKIMDDNKFRAKCNLFYGVDYKKFKVYEDPLDGKITIFIDTLDKNVVVLMDEEYNPIGVHRFNENENRDYYNAYYDCRSVIDYTSLFYNITISDMIKLSNRIMFSETNHGHSLKLIVNGENVILERGELYIELLAYIKFLGDMLEDYYKRLYQAKLLNIEYPSVTSYLYSIICVIDNYINQSIDKNERPWPSGLIMALGESTEKLHYYINILYSVINLLLREKGYKTGKGKDYMNLVTIDSTKNDILNAIDDLGALLDVSKEEVDERMKEVRKNQFYNEVDLEELLSHNRKKR